MTNSSRNPVVGQQGGRTETSIACLAESRTVLVFVLLLFLGFASLYIVFSPPPQDQMWDSLMYSRCLENPGSGGIQGNHPLGHVIHVAGFRLARQLGYDGRALPLISGINAVVGAGSVSLLFWFLVTVQHNSILSSLAIALVFASCYSFQSLAGTARIYSLAIGFQLLAWGTLLMETRDTQRRLLLVSGASVGLAVLTHQVNALLALAGIVLITGERRHWQSRLGSFLCAIALVSGTGYLLIGALATSSTSLATIVAWTRGYVGSYAACGSYLTWQYLPEAWKYATEGVLFSVWSTPLVKAVSPVLWAPLGLFVLLRAMQWRSLSRSRRTMLVAAVAHWSVSFLLIWWFEPFNPVYWSLTLVPALAALTSLDGDYPQTMWLHALGEPRTLQRLQGILLLAFATPILLLSLYRGIKAERNQAPTSGAVWASQSSAQDLLIPPPDLVAYLMFWENRPNTEHLMPPATVVEIGIQGRLDRLSQAIDDALCAGNAVYFAPASIDMLYQIDIDRYASSDARDRFRLFFEGYQQQPAFSYVEHGQTVQVNRIIGPMRCPGSSNLINKTCLTSRHQSPKSLDWVSLMTTAITVATSPSWVKLGTAGLYAIEHDPSESRSLRGCLGRKRGDRDRQSG